MLKEAFRRDPDLEKTLKDIISRNKGFDIKEGGYTPGLLNITWSNVVENENGKKVYAKEFKNINNKDKKAKFKPDKSGTYVVKINHYSTTFSEEPMKFTIRNISKETENAVRSDKN